VTSASGLAAYVNQRAGLGELPAKLRSEPCKIAYLGASITAQRKGYRPRLHEALQAATGQEHAIVTAGISGSGSISGAFMMDKLVLAHRPDLCFVDFASRDAAAPTMPPWVGPAAEGIALKLRSHGCQPCFLYMYRRDEGRGVYGPVQSAWEEVAAHYGVPSIDVATHVRDAVASGSITLDAILRDVTHTTPEGADFIADAIARPLLAIPPAEPVGLPHERLNEHGFGDARVVAAADVHVHDPQAREPGLFRFFYDYLTIAEGNRFECAFDGELVGMLLVLGPDTSAVRIDAGGEARQIVLRDE
jgi:lysophospholipase L1-like esterase